MVHKSWLLVTFHSYILHLQATSRSLSNYDEAISAVTLVLSCVSCTKVEGRNAVCFQRLIHQLQTSHSVLIVTIPFFNSVSGHLPKEPKMTEMNRDNQITLICYSNVVFYNRNLGLLSTRFTHTRTLLLCVLCKNEYKSLINSKQYKIYKYSKL